MIQSHTLKSPTNLNTLKKRMRRKMGNSKSPPRETDERDGEPWEGLQRLKKRKRYVKFDDKNPKQ